jgi:hypothetical protein
MDSTGIHRVADEVIRPNGHRPGLLKEAGQVLQPSSWRVRLAGLRAQLIVPYVVLTLVTAMVGTFVVTRLVTSSVRERFVNQLYEAGRVAADGIVRRERVHLETLRLMAFSAGVPEALEAGDERQLLTLLQPIAVNGLSAWSSIPPRIPTSSRMGRPSPASRSSTASCGARPTPAGTSSSA